MSQDHFNELTGLHIDVVHRSSLLLQQHTKFTLWCGNIGDVGAPAQTLSFAKECVIRGGRVLDILNALRVQGENPDMHWLQGNIIIFKMHEYISQQQEMMHKAKLLYMSPQRQIDISVYCRENVKARTADFLMESLVSVLDSVKEYIKERLVEFCAINTPGANVHILQTRIDRMKTLMLSCDSALQKTQSLCSRIHADSAGERIISNKDWKLVKNHTKNVSFDIISWIYLPVHRGDVPSNAIFHRHKTL
jgi:hypothetical protein